jgi:hypothetical protein
VAGLEHRCQNTFEKRFSQRGEGQCGGSHQDFNEPDGGKEKKYRRDNRDPGDLCLFFMQGGEFLLQNFVVVNVIIDVYSVKISPVAPAGPIVGPAVRARGRAFPHLTAAVGTYKGLVGFHGPIYPIEKLKQLYREPYCPYNADEKRYAEQHEETEGDKRRNNKPRELAAVEKKRGYVLQVQIDFGEDGGDAVHVVENGIGGKGKEGDEPEGPEGDDDFHGLGSPEVRFKRIFLKKSYKG